MKESHLIVEFTATEVLLIANLISQEVAFSKEDVIILEADPTYVKP